MNIKLQIHVIQLFAKFVGDKLDAECPPKAEPEVMRESGEKRRRNSHETEKTHTGRNHQKAA
jgi:hypothetical protein